MFKKILLAIATLINFMVALLGWFVVMTFVIMSLKGATIQTSKDGKPYKCYGACNTEQTKK